MTAADLVGRLLFLVGSLVFLALALARDHLVMAAGSALFLGGSLVYLVIEARQLRDRASRSAAAEPADRR